MQVSQFPKSDNAEIRKSIIEMENMVSNINQMSKSLGLSEAICFQMGKTSTAAQNVSNSMRDLLREMETLEKMSTK